MGHHLEPRSWTVFIHLNGGFINKNSMVKLLLVQYTHISINVPIFIFLPIFLKIFNRYDPILPDITRYNPILPDISGYIGLFRNSCLPMIDQYYPIIDQHRSLTGNIDQTYIEVLDKSST